MKPMDLFKINTQAKSLILLIFERLGAVRFEDVERPENPVGLGKYDLPADLVVLYAACRKLGWDITAFQGAFSHVALLEGYREAQLELNETAGGEEIIGIKLILQA